MPKRTKVPIAAGAGFTSVRATIPAHSVRIYEDGDRSHAFEYKVADDGFNAVFTTQDSGTIDSDAIKLVGHGRSGIIARPPNYNADGVPAVGDEYVQMRDKDGNAITVVLEESENEL